MPRSDINCAKGTLIEFWHVCNPKWEHFDAPVRVSGYGVGNAAFAYHESAFAVC